MGTIARYLTITLPIKGSKTIYRTEPNMASQKVKQERRGERRQRNEKPCNMIKGEMKGTNMGRNMAKKFTSIFIKYLVRILQDRVNDLDLPAGVGNGSRWIRAHQRWAKDDGQIVRIHSVDMRIVHDSIKM